MGYIASPSTCWTEVEGDIQAYGDSTEYWRLDASYGSFVAVAHHTLPAKGFPHGNHYTVALPANWYIFTKADRDEALH